MSHPTVNGHVLPVVLPVWNADPSVHTVCNYLGLGRTSIFAMMKTGELPSVRLSPRRIACRVSDLDAWLESRLRQPKAA